VSVTLERARQFQASGFTVIPVKPRSKEPDGEWKRYQTVQPTDEDLVRWFGNGVRRNAGLLGTIVIESDTPEAEAWCQQHLPKTPMMTRSARGVHRHYRKPTGPDATFDIPASLTVNGGITVEIKRDGQYVVAPDSDHPSGHIYKEVEPWPTSLDEVPELPVHTIWHYSKKPAGRKKAEPLPKALSEGSRNDLLFKEACRLRHLGYEQDEIASMLETLNQQRCSPQVPEREIKAIAKSAARYAAGSQGDYPHTEIGDAEFFAEKHGADVRYDHGQQRWLLTSETGIWIADPIEQLRGFVVETMRDRQHLALALPEDKRNAAIRWALAGESTKRISNTLREARALPPIADDGTNWDREPFLLGTQNGVVELRTGEVRAALPEERITMRVRAPYNAEEKCSLWEQVINEVFPNDPALVAYVQRALGYAITADCREECFFVTWGEGANGKGTVINTVAYVLGEYADDVPFSTLARQDRNNIPADIAKLVGKRFVTAPESGETTHLNEARIKALTGRDPITARLLHKNFFTFQPVAKFWLSTNTKPMVRDDSDGFWRRVHLIPFTQSFVGRADKTLKDRLREEAPGILSWLVRGAMAWLRDGLNPPDVVLAATDEYRRENEPLTPFIDERCLIGDGYRVQASQLYKAYQQWCEDSHVRDWQRLTLTAFGRQMKKRFKVADDKRNVFYLGIGERIDSGTQHDAQPGLGEGI
jgi:putative DNA primase/helicase